MTKNKDRIIEFLVNEIGDNWTNTLDLRRKIELTYSCNNDYIYPYSYMLHSYLAKAVKLKMLEVKQHSPSIYSHTKKHSQLQCTHEYRQTKGHRSPETETT